MQNLRSVHGQVYRAGRSMGSRQARNFSSLPGSSNEWVAQGRVLATCGLKSFAQTALREACYGRIIWFSVLGYASYMGWEVVQVIKMLDRSAEEFQLQEKLFWERQLAKATRGGSSG